MVANSVASLTEISEIRGSLAVEITGNMVTRLLAALNESTEWGQTYILDFISRYDPETSAEAEMIIDRVTPRLAHANPAVVISAVKLVLKYMDFLSNNDSIRSLSKKLGASLITLVSSEQEITYVALRCINIII